ncbi:MAG: hypothetical protein LBC84_08480, partial [Prevotellaceae bacterium]|nr:hypothetical protein [Prevotellaceae bacterium]
SDTLINQNTFTQRHYTSVDSSYFEPVIEGMYLAVNGGAYSTAWRAKVSGIDVCGKTGTAQNPRKDHAVFICFAPRNDPKIALAVYLENAGFGGTWAAPIAFLMLEKYLTNTCSRPDLLEQVNSWNLIDNSNRR